MKTLFTLMFAIAATAINVYSQTIFIPSGSAGIGTSTTTGVGIGVSNPDNALQVAGDIKMASRFHFGTANAYGGSYGVIGMMTGIPGKSFAFYNYDGPVNELMTLNGSTGAVAINNGGLTVGGNVGIGLSNPSSKLTVNGDIQISSATLPMGLMTEVGGITPLLNMSLNFREPNKNTAYKGAAFRVDSRDNFQLFQWLKRDAGSTTEELLMCLLQNGNVGIGTANTGSFKLAVEGKIAAREVNVTMATPWPDYVFEKNYKLPSLEEVKSYIEENKHLPEVPSAKEMEANGINVGEMNMILLKKVEELTLHVIKLQEEVNELKKQK